MDALTRDLALAIRRLRRQPLFAILVVATLALGIGASAATFSVAHAVLLRGLPYRDAGRLGTIWVDFGEGGQSLPAISPLDFRDLEARSTRFAGFAGGTGSAVSLVGDGEPEQVELGRVTHDLFPLLGVAPALGRGFTAGEEVVDGPPVVVLSDSLWRRRFGADPRILGRTLAVDGSPMEIVGVMPPGFHLILPAEAWWLRDTELWAPLQDPYTGNRNRTTLNVLGRLAPGVSFEQAQEELAAIAAELRSEHQVHALSDTRIRVVPLERDVVKGVRASLQLLVAAGALVLLVACGNVANLMVARAGGRRGELALRVALGAGRANLLRQLLTEAAVVGIAGGLAGLTLAAWAGQLLLALDPAQLVRSGGGGLGGAQLGFAFGASLLAALLVGLGPALKASRLGAGALRAGGERGTVRPSGSSIGRWVIVGELAISLALLVAGGLLTRSFLALREVRPGFDSGGAVSLRLSLPRGRYPDAAARSALWDRLVERLRGLPGVVAVGGTSQLPLTGGGNQMPYAYDDATAQKWESVTADARAVTDDYFQAMGTRLLAGRAFDPRDDADQRLVVVVDERLAEKAFPGGDAVGRLLQVPVFRPAGVSREWLEVVGVVEHVRMHDLALDGREQVYFPHRQLARSRMDLVVRAEGDLEALARSLPAAVRGLDAELPIVDLRALSRVVEAAQGRARLTLVLIGGFAALALVLALVGLYAVIHFAVGERTRELSIRRALGAQSRDLWRWVLGYGMSLALAGVVLGLGVALLAGRLLAALLYDVAATDPATLVGAPLVLLAVALVACLVPARRAVRLDPMEVLRGE